MSIGTFLYLSDLVDTLKILATIGIFVPPILGLITFAFTYDDVWIKYGATIGIISGIISVFIPAQSTLYTTAGINFNPQTINIDNPIQAKSLKLLEKRLDNLLNPPTKKGASCD